MPDLSEASRRVDAAVQHRMEQDAIPGLSLAVTDGSELLYEKAYGVASVEASTPVEPRHFFEFGSIGKSFTCILLLQLAEEGHLSLHEPVTTYLPWFDVQSAFDPITLHHLMTHTAGIINGTDFPADSRFEVWALRDTKAMNPPGEHFHYSNVGHKTLGLVLQRVTGKSYGELVQHRILEPLRMRDTDPSITHETRLRLVTGYRPFYDDRPGQSGRTHVPATWLETDTADGCIAGTASDLARYLRMLMNRGESPNVRVLSETSYAAMTAPHAPLSADDLGLDTMESGGYGYGLYSFITEGRAFIGHSGGMVGYFAHMAGDLTTGIGAVTLINGPGSQRPVVDYALDVLRAALADEPLPQVPPQDDPMVVPQAEDYVGTFNSPGGSLTTTAAEGNLYVATPGGKAALEPHGKDAFLVHDPSFDPFLLQFERDSSDAIIGVHHGNRSWYAAGSAPEEREFPVEWDAYPGHYRSHNPWQSNFRIVLRSDGLLMVSPWGSEQPLADRGDGVFRIGDERSPEFIRFDTVVDGEAWRANLSGSDYYRFFTP